MSTGTRRQGREIALKMIYSLFDQDLSLQVALDDFWQSFRFRDDILGDALEDAEQSVPPEVRSFAEELVHGVYDQLETIDETLHSYSTNWSLERMARVDLALLRLSAYELLYRPDIPINVVINEAIEIGKRYGTKETPAFINGILDRIARSCRPK